MEKRPRPLENFAYRCGITRIRTYITDKLRNHPALLKRRGVREICGKHIIHKLPVSAPDIKHGIAYDFVKRLSPDGILRFHDYAATDCINKALLNLAHRPANSSHNSGVDISKTLPESFRRSKQSITFEYFETVFKTLRFNMRHYSPTSLRIGLQCIIHDE